MNLILDTDSYKLSHFLQYPPKTEGLFCYLESRGGDYEQTLFFGLQYILREYLSKPITEADVAEARDFAERHGEPFDLEGFKRIVEVHQGFMPIRIRAVPEGTLVPTRNVLMTVESTDPELFWLPTFLETMLLRVWYPTTVATRSWRCKNVIRAYLDLTSDAPEAELPFKLHDFGSRGVSSRESAGIGGMAHLVNFMGSDTIEGVRFAHRYYGEEMAGFSIPAAEHSTITAWGKDGESDAYANMLAQFARPGSLVAVVSDSYDLENAVKNIWCGSLRRAVIDSGATVIIRPDSGSPPEVVRETLVHLGSRFCSTFNSKGYRVLDHVRVIQGDGINEDSIGDILEAAKMVGFSATNIAFGMGGALLQQVNRDTLKFAYKLSSIRVDGEDRGVRKAPKDAAWKASKSGRLDLVKRNGQFQTVVGEQPDSELVTVFENGNILKEWSFAEVRERAAQSTGTREVA